VSGGGSGGGGSGEGETTSHREEDLDGVRLFCLKWNVAS